MISGLTIFTLAHVAVSLVGIGTGLVVVGGFFIKRRLDGWTLAFLLSTLLTSVSGFLFPVHHFMPSHGVGIISLLVLAPALFARYGRDMAGPWRLVYVITAMIALYLNVFVLIVQSFLKVPALKSLAPTQSEPPFQVTQLAVLLLFAALTVVASIRFRLHRPHAEPLVASVA
jgi:hypothetical protein